MKKYLFSTLVLCLLMTPVVYGGDIPGFEKAFYTNAKNEDPNEFLKRLFGQIGVPVQIESPIVGSVDGTFDETVASSFNRFSSMFNAYVYFENPVAVVYQSDDITERLLPMNNTKAQSAIDTINKLGVSDKYNFVIAVSGAGLRVVGHRRFVDRIEDIATNVRTTSKSISAKKSTASKITKIGTKVELRKYRLKYASVIDRTRVFNSEEVVMPGVLTQMRNWASGSQTPNMLIDDPFKSSDQKDQPPKLLVDHNRPEGFAPKFMANPQTNTLFIEDTIANHAKYQILIEDIDVEPLMVEIQATIIDINNTRQRELGINWRYIDGDTDVLLGNGSGSDTQLIPGSQSVSQGSGLTINSVLGDVSPFIARMRALENKGAAKFISKPHVIVNSGVEAVLANTTEFSVRLEGREAVLLAEKSFGTMLRLTATANKDKGQDTVSLDVVVEDGAKSGAQVDQIPEIQRSSLNTSVIMWQGQSMLLGGLINENSIDSVNQVPILGDVPILGNLFKSKSKRIDKTERLFLITPRIVQDDRTDNSAGPVLRGNIDDIIASSGRRDAAAEKQINLVAERQALEVNGPSLFNKNKPESIDTPVTGKAGVKAAPIKNPLDSSGRQEGSSIAAPQKRKVWKVRNAKLKPDQWQAVNRK